ncbi:hypothetical protein SFRURICE_010547 [Spodoptera frugiperda]|nr:hypothetical protein SFRURICE_010547 [Spodoptera frugiperda]
MIFVVENGRSLSSARGTELYNLHSSVPLTLLRNRSGNIELKLLTAHRKLLKANRPLMANGRSLSRARGTELCRLYSSIPLTLLPLGAASTSQHIHPSPPRLLLYYMPQIFPCKMTQRHRVPPL